MGGMQDVEGVEGWQARVMGPIPVDGMPHCQPVFWQGRWVMWVRTGAQHTGTAVGLRGGHVWRHPEPQWAN